MERLFLLVSQTNEVTGLSGHLAVMKKKSKVEQNTVESSRSECILVESRPYDDHNRDIHKLWVFLYIH